MSKKLKIGILGCGDFLRWQSEDILKSNKIEVAALFDPRKEEAEKYAAKLGGKAVDTDEEIFNNPDIDIVCLFVPPWIRKELVEKAVAAGKHIITTKPLGATVEDCEAMLEATKGKVKAGVFYGRTGDTGVEMCKKIFDGGEIGKLALYKRDWLHHYPEWNKWAIDPEKNGGPFMDAMIHNMNAAMYLMGRKAVAATYFSDNHAHSELKCGDTEFMKLDFEDNGSAHIFITWAADLAVYSKEGNDREHIDLYYMVTDKGWRVTQEWKDEGLTIIASKDGKEKTWLAEDLSATPYDSFVETVETDGELPGNIPGIEDACNDIKLIRLAEKNKGKTFDV